MIFNRTHLEHAGYSILFQLGVALVWLPFTTWMVGLWIGGFAAFFFFLGREHAQVQRSRSLGVFQAFDVRLWGWDARLDLAVSPVACLLVILLSTLL